MKTMRRLYLFMVLTVLLGFMVVFTPATEAQTIYALLVIMDGDPVNYQQYEKSSKLILNLLQAVQNKRVCDVNITSFNSGSNNAQEWPTRARILKWVREVRPGRNDAIFIYYAGHGARDTSEADSIFGGTFFDLTGEYLFRKELVNTLKSSSAWKCRLKMLITDTCSTDTSIQIPTQFLGTSPITGYPEERVYRQLFVEHTGFLHITSATEGEYSWGDSTNGGWFTNGLVRSINSHADALSYRFVGWNEVLTDAQEEVNEFIKQHREIVGYKLQHPKAYLLPDRVIPAGNILPGRLINLAKARILKVWVDHNQFEGAVKGMRIHVNFKVDNLKGGAGRVNAYFYAKNGKPLKDFNGSYRTINGNVSVGREFQPGYVNTLYEDDFHIFMPYSELHMAGKRDLKFCVQIFEQGTGNALSPQADWVHLTYTGPEAHVLKIWVDHNQFEGVVKGMRIHVNFKVDNLKGGRGSVNAYFYYANGNPLKDFNKSYRTIDGNVSVGREFQPGYVNTLYEDDFHIFMPYSELHMSPGKHDLKFNVEIFERGAGNALGSPSDWVHFTLTK